MLDRTKAPNKITPGKILIPKNQPVKLANGAQLIAVNAGTQDVSKIEIIFNAGTRYQNQALSARAAISMLSEGTTSKTSQQIAEMFDFYGSFPEHSFDRDFASLTLYSTNKFLSNSLGVLTDMMYNPVYPAHELDIFKKKGKQALIVELEKVVTISRQNFFSTLFSNQHPYGAYATPNDFEILERGSIVDFHNQFHSSNNCLIILSGKISDKEIRIVEENLGTTHFGANKNIEPATLPQVLQTQQKVFSYKNDALQSAIRIGKLMFKRNHPDYPKFMVLNTILGGYFGSRLMRNIREDKGYTYGISSTFLPFKDTSVFVIGTEVGAEFTKNTLSEIYKEIDRLCSEEVSTEELELVKSHLIGEVLRTFDGPFAIADSIASLYEYNYLDYSFYERTIDTINTVTPKELIEIANKYLNKNDLVESVAGKIEND
ncbi:MAG: insulinase family protein [Bacteroidales bacterium]|nr:MAG: insulinase family protein [Bacteroidales bacterium]